MTDGYIVIPNWDRFQHYKDRRPAWIKLHLELLGSDAWHDLSPDDRCLLVTVWMLVARYGNGRLKADQRWLMAQANVPYGPRSRNLNRLADAGFITVSATKPLAKRYADDSPEVEGLLRKPKGDSAASDARRNGDAAAHKKKALAAAIATAKSVTAGDTPELAEHTIRDLFPDLADKVLAAMPKTAPKETT